VIIQIYTMQSPEEALACVDAGVDHLGLTPPEGLPGQLSSLDAMRAIVDAVGDRAKCVALTVDTDPERILAMVRAVGPAILHLCPLEGAMPPGDVAALRAMAGGIPVMQAVSVTGPESIAVAEAYAAVADMLILDTQSPDIAGIGASGAVHDWGISRRIVEAVRVPVILAGGLSPENVAEAIRAVRPWGVDSLTHTNRPLPGGGFRKDLVRVAAFVAATRSA